MTLWNPHIVSSKNAQKRHTVPVRRFFPFPRLLACVAAICLGACAATPITPQTIRGKYEIEGAPEGMWYGGEMIVLGNGTFEYSLYTPDLVENPQSMRYPIHGRYKLDGSTITFLNPSVPSPQRTLTHRRKLFVLWTPKQVEDYRQTGAQPADLLYQHP
jgi:hypothetical protein